MAFGAVALLALLVLAWPSSRPLEAWARWTKGDRDRQGKLDGVMQKGEGWVTTGVFTPMSRPKDPEA